jgi:hypothetical protein
MGSRYALVLVILSSRNARRHASARPLARQVSAVDREQ